MLSVTWISVRRHVARIWKRGGGFFERVRKLQTTLTGIFIVLESHGLSDFGRFILKIETEISAKIGNSNAFSAQKREISEKKVVFIEIETNFLVKIGNSNAFLAQKQVISKKKKKVFTEIETDFQAKIGNSNAFSGRFTTSTWQLRHPISFGGRAVFIFSPKIGLKSTKNVQFCILYRPIGGGGARAPPPPLATVLALRIIALCVSSLCSGEAHNILPAL